MKSLLFALLLPLTALASDWTPSVSSMVEGIGPNRVITGLSVRYHLSNRQEFPISFGLTCSHHSLNYVTEYYVEFIHNPGIFPFGASGKQQELVLRNECNHSLNLTVTVDHSNVATSTQLKEFIAFVKDSNYVYWNGVEFDSRDYVVNNETVLCPVEAHDE